MTGRWLVALLLVAQAACAIFFVSDILMTAIGLRTKPIAWQTRELLELGAAIGLILGLLLGAYALNRSMRLHAQAEARLRAAASAFAEMLEEKFLDWGLTPAERDVALFAIKGLSTAEIAGLRETSEGTVKAQTAAIYRKAGVSGRSQLLSLFIDEMMAGTLSQPPAGTARPSPPLPSGPSAARSPARGDG